jgi:putative aldouronate transport system substrate-binding protein
MRHFTILLAVMLLLSGVAFAAGEVDASAQADLTLSEPGTYPIVDEPITIDIVTLYYANESSGIPQDAPFTDSFEDLTGMRFNFVEVVEGAQAREKFNLLLASGDLPDVLAADGLFDKQAVYLSAQNGSFIDLRQMIEDRAPNLVRELDAHQWIADQVPFPDGAIYGMPKVEAGCFHCSMSQKFWIYTPWLDALDLDVPETTEEFYEVLLAFKTQDPNGNGEADEVPLSGATTAWNGDPLPFIMNSFIYTDKGHFLQRQGSSVEFVANTPEWREGLRFMNRLYDEGLLGPEAYIQNQAQLRAMTENPVPIVGGFTGGWFGAYTINNAESGRFFEYRAIAPLEGPAGVRQTTYSAQGVGYSGLITSAAENPEAIVQAWDYFYSGWEAQAKADNMGELGVDFRELTDAEKELGLVARDGSPAKYLPTDFEVVADQKWDDGWRRIFPTWQPTGVMGFLPDTLDLRTNSEYRLMTVTRDLYEPYRNERYLPPNLLVRDNRADQLADLRQVIIGDNNTGLVGQYTIEFITGALDIESDADWDTYVAELERAGVDQYVEIWQEALSDSGY